ncbi:MAG: condensation domain-containing protein, partial [Candidatus Methylumidiphilus sp.]
MLNQAELEDVLPLSPLQEGFLFLTQLDGAGPDVYIIQTVLDLEGAVDSARLQTAAQALLNRHPNLRAAFRRTAEGRPVALIPRRAQLPWRVIDLSGLAPEAQQAEAERVLNEERGQRFDLAHPPLLRMALIRLSENRHRLSIANHHILADGWCLSIMVKELSALYASGGDLSVLPPLNPYRSYLAWLAAQDRVSAEAAWRTALAGLEAPTLLTGEDWRRGALMPDKLVAELPEALTAALAAEARRQGVTMNTFAQAAWGILLGRLTGQDDIVFGATTSGRPPELDGVESMIGVFINSLPVRLKLLRGESVQALLARLQTEQGRLLGHQHLSLLDVQQIADLGQLFDTLVVYQNYPFERRRPGEPGIGLGVGEPEIRNSTHYPLTLILTPGARLSLSLLYRPDLFSAEDAAALLGRLQLILAQLATAPELPVHRLDLLTAAERHTLLADRNATAAAVPGLSLPALLEAQAEAQPDTLAVVFEEQALTYAELNAQANRLAHALNARGVGAESIVALLLPRSLELVVGLWAALKAGAGYLPLDPGHPQARLATMLDDARPALVLATAASLAALPP